MLAALAAVACEPAAGPAAESPDGRPERIVTLAPSLAELVFAAGAGDRLVGVSAYSDYPPAVRELPVIGDAFAVDREQLALLAPDLLLAWESGTPAHRVEALRAAGHRVEVIRTRGLADVPEALRQIGALAGSEAEALAVARDYEAKLAELREQYAGAGPIRVFYQVSRRPLYTVTGEHYIGELIALCGGVNVFAELGGLAPTVSEEAVLERDPEALLAAGEPDSDALDDWQRWPRLAANRYGNRFYLPPSLTGRAGPRLPEAGRALCERLETARRHRDQS